MGTEPSSMKMRMRRTDIDTIREAKAMVEAKRRELYNARRHLAKVEQEAADHTLIEVGE